MASRAHAVRWSVALLCCSVAMAGMPQTIQAEGTFDIGVSTILTPPGSVTQGVQARQALELVADWMNDQGGVVGKKIRLVVGDDQGTTEGGRTVAERLITRDKVSVITGQVSSTSVLASLEVAKKHNVPVVNVNGWASGIRTFGYRGVFNPGPYTTRVITATVDTLVALGSKKVFGAFDNTDAGFNLQKELRSQLAARAPGITYKDVTLDRTAKDYLPFVLQMQQDQPDVIVSELIAPAGYILMNQLFDQGVAPTKEVKFFEMGGMTDNPDFWQNVRESGKGILAFGHYHPKFKLPAIGVEFRKRFVEKYKTEPGRISFQAADALLLILDAAKRANSTESAALIDALEKANYEGTRGQITFDMTPGPTYHQWVDVPYAIYQITKVDQKLDDTVLLKQSDGPLDISLIQDP